MITLTIDGEEVTVAPGTTILAAAQTTIPTLCFDERQAPFGACRVCLVGVEGAPGPVASCTTLVREGMQVDTQDPTARRVATAVVELVLSELPQPPAEHTELAQVARMLGVGEPRWPGEPSTSASTTSATRTWRSSTSCASPAGAACARATRSRGRSR